MLGYAIPILAQPNRIGGVIDDTRKVVLKGSVHPKAQSRYDQGPVDPSLKIGYVTLMLKPSASQQAQLERLLEEEQDRSSPNYHQWLTPEQFANRFSLSQTDYTAVVGWIESHGLHVENVAHARNWVAFSGAAQQVESAFQTEIHRYVIDGETYFANATELQFPQALESLVSGVRGLHDFWRKPSAVFPQYTTGSAANQLAPDDWATIYDVKPLYSSGIDGTGQRLAIIGRSDFNQASVNTFRSMFGLPPSQIEMHLVGPDPGITNAASEATLDLQWSGAIARNATIVYVYANNFDDAAQGAIDQNLAPVMSQSFGTCEPQAAVGNRAMAQQANAEGITWLASSGDSGGAGCDPHGFFATTGNSALASGGLAVDIPASFPEVTAVGGAEFNEGSGQYWNNTNNSNGGSVISYIPEVVWNETGVGGLLASGGGASIYFSKPAWQTGPGVPSDNARDVPDVAFSAAGNHDPYVVVNANGQRATGGTSAASPSFAGVVALLNQYVVSKGFQSAPGLGNINPELYRLAQSTTNVFHDITQGNNMVPCAPNSPDCSNGSLGFNAGLGYDQATGLGSIDAYNLVTQWNTAASNAATATTTTVAANPASINLADPVQLTATVTAVSGTGVPTGTVTFTSGRTILGVAALVNVTGAAMATMTASGPELPVGSATVIATYGGNNNFNSSTGSIVVSVAPQQSPSSVMVVSITPNPAHEGQTVRVTLTEVAGIGTTITAWSINGVDNFYRFATDFGSAVLQPYGSLSASFASAVPAVIPSARVYLFAGVDTNGRQWSQQYTLTLEGAVYPGMSLSSVPATVQQNPAADPSCQWSQQIILQEQNGLAVELTGFLVNGADWTNRMPQLFGTAHLAPLGVLQASICWPASNPPQNVTYEMDGTDQTGTPVKSTLTTSFAGPDSSPATLSVAKNSVTLAAATSSQPSTSSLALNLSGSGQPWTISKFPSNQSTAWLTVNPLSGTGSQQVTITASGSGLASGAYNAMLVVQAANASPQFIEVPVVFMVGASSGISIGGVTNAGSYQQIFAPGMLMSVFGALLAPTPQSASTLPLPLTMAGVSATVNGVAAPLYYVSSGQLNIQVPYETGVGPAVLGVNNNGQVASYIFTVTPSAPGILALIPSSSGKRGDTLTLFETGDGDVSPPLATGASPFYLTPLALLPQPKLPFTVTVGGIEAEVRFAGIPPGVAGVTQINFVIPSNASVGVQPVVVMVGSVSSVAANLTIMP